MRSEDRAPRVLLATDGDHAADEALELVSAVVRREAEIEVVSVVPTGVPMVRHLHGRVGPLEERHRRASTVASAAALELRRAGFRATAATPEGRPGGTIARLASLDDADLVVVGAANPGRRARLFGSVAHAVVSRAASPVLVVRRAAAAAPTEVVLAVDDDRRARAAADVVAHLLDPRRCHVTVVSVAELLAPALSPPRVRYTTATAEAEPELLLFARGHVRRTADRLRSRGFEVDERVVAGEPVHRILDQVATLAAGLVVVGGRGLGAVEGALVGSVSRAILAEAPATLVVPG